MIVVDASAVLEILSLSAMGQELSSVLVGVEIHAPHLIDLEVFQTLRRWTLKGTVSPADADEMIRKFRALKIIRHPHTPLLDDIWALRHNLTAYDASSYLALARALDAEVLTMDSGLRKMATRH